MVKINKNILINERIGKTLEVMLLLFSLFIVFQIVRKMLGGSWTTEEIIMGLLIFNLGAIFTIGLMMAQLKSDHGHLKNQFKSLASDFKSSVKKIKN